MKEKDMTKKELISKSGISSEDYDLMKNNEDVCLATLRKNVDCLIAITILLSHL